MYLSRRDNLINYLGQELSVTQTLRLRTHGRRSYGHLITHKFHSLLYFCHQFSIFLLYRDIRLHKLLWIQGTLKCFLSAKVRRMAMLWHLAANMSQDNFFWLFGSMLKKNQQNHELSVAVLVLGRTSLYKTLPG